MDRILYQVNNTYAWSMIGQMIPPLHEALLEDCCSGIVEQAPFRRVNNALSAGTSSMIIQPTHTTFSGR